LGVGSANFNGVVTMMPVALISQTPNFGAAITVEVLPQHSIIFLVDAEGLLNRLRNTGASRESGLQITDLT